MNKISEITDVFFDLDHTLWDFDKNSGLAFERVFKKHKITIGINDFLKVYEPINLEYWRLFRNEKVGKQDLRRGRLNDAFKKFNFEFSMQVIDEMADSYIEELPIDNHLFEGTFEILDYLSKKYTLHIITNGFEEVQYKKIKNSGIRKHFKSITTSEEIGVKKPNPVIFKRALEKTNALIEKSIMIGDSFEADILGAENVGLQTLFFNYKNEQVSNTYPSVSSLLEIKNIL
ncbi:MAG: YjjG family noncanonical pyrimidine nucleotidase [Flavobacteriaceae bacterium]|nr:YjjG family noncanonical pyrimidine nucleotidase [Flavobacteriaceae bacterium]